MAFLQKLNNVTAFIFDIDGVLTDGMITATESGEFLRTFNIKDGYALQLAVKKGYKICIISGAKGISLENRFKNLGIQHVHLGISNKLPIYHTFLQEHNLSAEQVLYMGDDVPDKTIMHEVGVPTCPNDAVPEIKEISDFISPFNGGKGAVRDIIEKVMRSQEKWSDAAPSASASAI